MADVTYTIDCGQETPFTTGRKVRRPDEDTDQLKIDLLETDGSVLLTVDAVKQVFNPPLVGYRGAAGGQNLGFFFDTSRTRMVGIVQRSGSIQGVYGAKNNNR